MAQRGNLWVSGLKAVVGALVGTLAVWGVARALFEIPAEFAPLNGPGPTIFFTLVSGIGAVGVFGLVSRFASRPAPLFRGIAGVVLLLSFAPDLWLLSDGAAEAFPGATSVGVGVLMVMHVAAAAVIVWALTSGSAAQKVDQ
jgi:hypothetical protein